MGRTSDARSRLIESAFGLWFARSYSDVGVNEICAHAGVRKGSFYHFFPSKSDLALAVIGEVERRFQTEIVGVYLEGPDVPPLERLEKLIEHNYVVAVAGKDESGHVYGCPIGNLATEMATQDEVLRGRLDTFFDHWAAAFTALLDEAVARGDVPPHDTRTAGLSLLAYVQGVSVLVKTRNDPSLIRTIGPTIVAIASAPAAVAA